MVSREDIEKSLIERHGEKIFKALSKGRIAIAGLGGLGSNIAFALVRAGVGHIHLVDFDRVDLSNLNRQQYCIEHIGMYKTEALRKQLIKINPYTDIKITSERVTDENIDRLFGDCHILCEAFDCPEAKAMLTEKFLMEFNDKFLVGASGLAGFGSSNIIKTKKVMERYYLCGDGISDIDAEGSLMSARAALCAAHQANMVIRILTGHMEP